MKKYGQVFLREKHANLLDAKECRKIEILASNDQNNGFFVGWKTEQKRYDEIAGYAKQYEKEFYLWLPVFAEFESQRKFRALENIAGDQIVWNSYDDNESFAFYCPSTAVGQWISLFEEYFAQISCCGILLDRVRFPSMVIGWKALFTCTCEKCCEFYRAHGISKQDISDIYRETGFHIEEKSNENPLGITAYKDGGYTFQNQGLQKYLDARNQLIAAQVHKIYTYLKSKGYLVGLDLFTPFAAYFLGQSYQMIISEADFVKSMLYRYTNTPAGLRYEIDTMTRALCSTQTDENEFRRKRGFFEELIGADRKADFRHLLQREYTAAKHAAGEKEVLVGVETNWYEGQCEITPERIKTNKRELSGVLADGMIASWDILTSPDENLEIFINGE